jgi:protoheme IX farnesyltransferase
MRTAETAYGGAPAQEVGASLKTGAIARIADYVELAKPRIAVLVLVSVGVGYSLGSAGDWRVIPLLHALFGIALIAAASSALNQLFERSTDARMQRTANRPLPAGRLLPGEVFLFAAALTTFGAAYLAVMVNPMTALLTVSTLLLYAFVYTPLKRVTSLCTLAGAIPGALPPVLGWVAAGGTLDIGAFSLFAILFLWQFPHFLAIGWLYRDEYSQAGLRMLPAIRSAGTRRVTESAATSPSDGGDKASGPNSNCFTHLRPRVTGLLSVAYALALLPVSLLPSQIALAGNSYFMLALVLGLGYLFCAVRFLIEESNRSARRLLAASLLYLPVLLMSLTWDHFQLLR